MNAPVIEGWLHSAGRWSLGRVRQEAGRITRIESSDQQVEGTPPGPWILPGFIDLHVHGGDGADVMAGADAVRRAARYHLSRGTTAWCPTTVTAPPAEIERALVGIEAVRREPRAGEALVLGAHLEGPFLSGQRLGAQPPFAQLPEVALAQRWMALARTRVATFAPELEASDLLLDTWVQAGVRAQIGHTCASAERCRLALERGASGFTHLYNAMSGAHHREPGAVSAALAFAQWAECLCDGVHVSGPAVLAALRAIPGLYAVSDATPAAGAPDGPFTLGQQRVIKRGERVLLEDGVTLAGSASPLERGFAWLLSLGLAPELASQLCSERPARYLGLGDRGALEVGRRADLVLVDAQGAVQRVWLAGAPV